MPEFNDNLLLSTLIFLLFEGGSGAVAYQGVEWLSENWRQFASLSSELRRVASHSLSAALALGAYAFTLWLGVAGPTPATPQEWVTRLFGVGATAVVASSLVHGRLKLADRKSSEYGG